MKEDRCRLCGCPDNCYTQKVAEAVLYKIKEIEFNGRDPIQPFADNNLPTFVQSDTVVILRRDLQNFHDDFAMMAAFLAYHFKTPDVAPIHLLPELMERLHRSKVLEE